MAAVIPSSIRPVVFYIILMERHTNTYKLRHHVLCIFYSNESCIFVLELIPSKRYYRDENTFSVHCKRGDGRGLYT